MLSINEKKFLNLPEAVQWLLNNNALPFQCKSNYVANTVIAKSDIINPSPAEIKVGSLVLFADSKVGTVSGVTDAGFMVGQDCTDIGSQLNQITSIDLDASQHLIITLSNGDTIDAGLVKGLAGLSIDASQHLIATYNDGSTQDLGAIFSGNVNIAGNLTADSIIENMSGYSMTPRTEPNATIENIYGGIVKTGNKLTIVQAFNITRTGSISVLPLSDVTLPADVASKIFVNVGSTVVTRETYYALNLTTPGDTSSLPISFVKYSPGFGIVLYVDNSMLNLNEKYYCRFEVTLLLSDNLLA